MYVDALDPLHTLVSGTLEFEFSPSEQVLTLTADTFMFAFYFFTTRLVF